MLRPQLVIPVPAALQDQYRAQGLTSDAIIDEVLASTARRAPELPALFDLTSGAATYTYAEIHRRVTSLVSHWRSHKVVPGDVIMLQAPNSTELFIACWAAFQAGCVCVPVVDIYRAHEVSALIDAVQPDVIVAAAVHRGFEYPAMFDSLLDDKLIATKTRTIIGGERPGWVPFELALSDDGAGGEPGLRHPDDPALVLFTSGTTSSPKAVVHSSRTLISDVHQMALAKGFGWQDRRLLAVPLAHLTGVLLGMLLPGATGGGLVLSRPSSVEQTVEELLEYRVTEASGPPRMLSMILDRADGDRVSLRRWSPLAWGGTDRPIDLIMQAEALGIQSSRGYGSTEFPSASASAPGTNAMQRLANDGRLGSGVECEAVDPDTREVLPAGREGELRVRGPERMVGYLDPDQTSADIDKEGWYYTGDLGSVDANKNVLISGRLKDIISRGGEKFSANDIESVLLRHPAIETVAVVAAPDRRLGEVPAAFMVASDGAEIPSPEELTTFLSDQGLASQKTPARWRTVQSMPVSSTGKVQKAELRKTLTIDDAE